MIKLKNVSLVFQGGSVAISNLTTTVQEGEFVYLVGHSGSGKSSFLKCLAGLMSYEGEIKTELDKFGKISYVPQRPSVPVGMTLAEFVLLGRSEYTKWYFSETSLDREKCKEAITSLSLSKLAGRFVETLSGGELQRAVLARAIAQEATLLLLDEPTSALDIVNQVEVMSYLTTLQKKHKLTIIVALHDLNLALNYSDRALLLKDGGMIGFGHTYSVMTAKGLSDVYKSPIEIRSQEDGTKTVFVKYNLS